MLLFRSEEHVRAWCQARKLEPRGILSLKQIWDLARIWYHDRMDPTWRRKTADEADAIFAQLGLTGDFWKLRP
jgi:hypothetical protein